ncbi:MAG: hypothetical protein AAGC76_19455 [Luteibacter sp.]|uniref:hypothetical protein n=1 Tax=Luteibacter sp. TaxID=1886636 RepID=UPI002809865C|nr:hypothetical protein [Luteibacter sp.]MDQ7998024.1 hypothetical protein [Luteibacter sp.]
MLRSHRLFAMTLLAITPLTASCATGPLEVTLRTSENPQEAELGIVVVTVTNQSDRSLLILTADSALVTDGDRLFNDVMSVMDADGHAVAYHGRAVRPALGNPQAYATLAPGERKESRVDLPANYAVDGGTYTVTYTQRYGEVGEMDRDAAPAREAHSNALKFYANTNLIQAKRGAATALLKPAAARAPGPDNTCRETDEHPDRTTINEARSLAASWAFFGYSDAGELFGTSYAPDATGKIVWRAKLSNDANYTT